MSDFKSPIAQEQNIKFSHFNPTVSFANIIYKNLPKKEVSIPPLP
jgi:glycerol uptake facilitator-like aquaporin